MVRRLKVLLAKLNPKNLFKGSKSSTRKMTPSCEAYESRCSDTHISCSQHQTNRCQELCNRCQNSLREKVE